MRNIRTGGTVNGWTEPDGELDAEGAPTSSDLLNAVDTELAAGEKRLREMERYVTSDTFTLRSRFRQL